MPQWLCNQLTKAFQQKNRRQIRLLNDCWFFYRMQMKDVTQDILQAQLSKKT